MFFKLRTLHGPLDSYKTRDWPPNLGGTWPVLAQPHDGPKMESPASARVAAAVHFMHFGPLTADPYSYVVRHHLRVLYYGVWAWARVRSIAIADHDLGRHWHWHWHQHRQWTAPPSVSTRHLSPSC